MRDLSARRRPVPSRSRTATTTPIITPIGQEWSPDEPTLCGRCGRTLRGGDTTLEDVGGPGKCIARTPDSLCWERPKMVIGNV